LSHPVCFDDPSSAGTGWQLSPPEKEDPFLKKHFLLASRVLFVFLLAWPFGQNGVRAADDQPGAAAEKPVLVARVDGFDITEQMVLEEINWIANELGQRLPPDQRVQKERLLFSSGLERTINFALLKNAARAQGITVDTAELDQRISDLRKKFPTEKEFNQALASQGLNENRLREMLNDGLLHKKVIDANVKPPDPPTDEAIGKFYTENPQFFMEPEQVRASHILLRVPPDSSEKDKETVKKKMLDIQADIKNGKTPFEEAAKQHSQDPGSAVRGGDLDYFPRGRMVKPFDEMAFSTPVGEMSGIVESQFGYHLIKVVDHKKEQKVPLENVKEKIKEFLAQQNLQDATNQYVSKLREAAKIETLMSEEEWNARHTPGGAIEVDPNSLK
jgi:peptidyl-prolyl cis-trans isomerase C